MICTELHWVYHKHGIITSSYLKPHWIGNLSEVVGFQLRSLPTKMPEIHIDLRLDVKESTRVTNNTRANKD